MAAAWTCARDIPAVAAAPISPAWIASKRAWLPRLMSAAALVSRSVSGSKGPRGPPIRGLPQRGASKSQGVADVGGGRRGGAGDEPGRGGGL